METDRNFLLLDRFRQVARLMRMGWTPDDIPTVKEKMIRTRWQTCFSKKAHSAL